MVPLIVLEEMKKFFIVLMKKCDSQFLCRLGGFMRSWISPCYPQTGCSQELSFCFNLVSEKRL